MIREYADAPSAKLPNYHSKNHPTKYKSISFGLIIDQATRLDQQIVVCVSVFYFA